MKTILITGSAGFIGAHLILRLIENNKPLKIVGIDNLNTYYDPSLKEYRLQVINNKMALRSKHQYTFIKGSITDNNLINRLFAENKFDLVVNLAAQAGVRYSVDNPDAYIESNILGFYHILEACRYYSVKHLIYASSSSVYGDNKKVPFSTNDCVDTPASLYAATKKSNELMAYCYSKLYNITTIGLRFFTVYGPCGRPDMAYFDFTNRLLRDEEIQLYNYGNCSRDFTYIDDAIDGIIRIIDKIPNLLFGKAEEGIPPYAIYNIGSGKTVKLLDFVQILNKELIRARVLPSGFDIKAHEQLIPMQPGDVPITYADIESMKRDFNYNPTTNIREGLRKFAQWYKGYNMSQK